MCRSLAQWLHTSEVSQWGQSFTKELSAYPAFRFGKDILSARYGWFNWVTWCCLLQTVAREMERFPSHWYFIHERAHYDRSKCYHNKRFWLSVYNAHSQWDVIFVCAYFFDLRNLLQSFEFEKCTFSKRGSRRPMASRMSTYDRNHGIFLKLKEILKFSLWRIKRRTAALYMQIYKHKHCHHSWSLKIGERITLTSKSMTLERSALDHGVITNGSVPVIDQSGWKYRSS
jgi:hypothetical protein